MAHFSSIYNEGNKTDSLQPSGCNGPLAEKISWHILNYFRDLICSFIVFMYIYLNPLKHAHTALTQ